MRNSSASSDACDFMAQVSCVEKTTGPCSPRSSLSPVMKFPSEESRWRPLVTVRFLKLLRSCKCDWGHNPTQAKLVAVLYDSSADMMCPV